MFKISDSSLKHLNDGNNFHETIINEQEIYLLKGTLWKIK